MFLSNFLKGYLAEKLLILWLIIRGHKIIAHRFVTVAGELDVISQNGDVLVFSEIKFRSKALPLDEVISARQNRRNKRAIDYFCRLRDYDQSWYNVEYRLYHLSLNRLPKFVQIDLY